MPSVALAVPVVSAFLALGAFVIAEAAGARPFAVAPAANVSEAMAFGDAGQALVFIASGQDPNYRWTVRQDLVDSRGALHLTAVQAAVLARRPELVEFLLRHGARADDPEGLACLAQAVGRGAELPPSVFGATNTDYYHGPPIGGREALAQCGFPSD
jgi:hypothetical protein